MEKACTIQPRFRFFFFIIGLLEIVIRELKENSEFEGKKSDLN